MTFPGKARKQAQPVLMKIWDEISRLDEEFTRTGRADLLPTIEGLKKQAFDIMVFVKKTEETEYEPESEEQYADRKFDEEVEFLSKYGNLKVS